MQIRRLELDRERGMRNTMLTGRLGEMEIAVTEIASNMVKWMSCVWWLLYSLDILPTVADAMAEATALNEITFPIVL